MKYYPQKKYRNNLLSQIDKELSWHQAHDILSEIVAPRPIALVSIIGKDQIDASKLKIITRLGGKGKAYCRTTDIFDVQREK